MITAFRFLWKRNLLMSHQEVWWGQFFNESIKQFSPLPHPPEKNPFPPLKEPPQTEESHRSPRKANDGTNESGAAQHIWSQLKSYHNFTTSRHQVANHIKCIPNAQCITELKVNIFKRWRLLNTRQASTPVDTW